MFPRRSELCIPHGENLDAVGSIAETSRSRQRRSQVFGTTTTTIEASIAVQRAAPTTTTTTTTAFPISAISQCPIFRSAPSESPSPTTTAKTTAAVETALHATSAILPIGAPSPRSQHRPRRPRYPKRKRDGAILPHHHPATHASPRVSQGVEGTRGVETLSPRKCRRRRGRKSRTSRNNNEWKQRCKPILGRLHPLGIERYRSLSGRIRQPGRGLRDNRRRQRHVLPPSPRPDRGHGTPLFVPSSSSPDAHSGNGIRGSSLPPFRRRRRDAGDVHALDGKSAGDAAIRAHLAGTSSSFHYEIDAHVSGG
mmetsp:Transcript_16850/g.32147  ORF Transcript_16850/g.32147 Transcript_16850/m.32147 type:complete len:310 (+) Transcript_16850:2-931(+)